MIPFGEWLPDLPDFQNPGATVATNVIPNFASYRPFKDSATIDKTGGVPPASTVLGATHVNIDSTSGAVHAGTAAKLHRYDYGSSANAWADVTRTTVGDYTATTWRFAQFGKRIIAVNGSDVAQSYVEGSSTDYAALAGSPPSAPRTIAVVRDFLQMAPASNVLTWCAQNDPTDWTPSATTQADSQEIPEGGIIMGQVGGQYGTIFMESAIYRQTYIGSPIIFQFDKISANTGLLHDGTIATHDDMIFFWSGEALLMLVGGQQIIPIGRGKVDKFLRDDMERAATAPSAFLSACIDPQNQCYCLLYGAQDDVADIQKKILFYHWPSQRWSVAEVGTYTAN